MRSVLYFRIRNLKRGSNQETYSKEETRRCDRGGKCSFVAVVMSFDVAETSTTLKIMQCIISFCSLTREVVTVHMCLCVCKSCTWFQSFASFCWHKHTQYICSKVGHASIEPIYTFVHSVRSGQRQLRWGYTRSLRAIRLAWTYKHGLKTCSISLQIISSHLSQKKQLKVVKKTNKVYTEYERICTYVYISL